MSTDWHEWHGRYDDPGSSLSHRLETVRDELRRALDARSGTPTHLTSICSGDGRDTLPVLADGSYDVAAVLVELDPDLADRARVDASGLASYRVEVRTADAGLLSSFNGIPPADVFLACGVFGNITDDDLETTIAALPSLLAPDAVVIWTRGATLGDGELSAYGGDPSDLVRDLFAHHGFTEERFVRPSDAGFRVGVHRLTATGTCDPAADRMFAFAR